MIDIVGKVLGCVQDAGVRCVRALPSARLPVLSEALAAVGLSRTSLQPQQDTVYTEWEVFLDVYAAYRLGSACCESASHTIEATLCKGLADCNIEKVQCGEIYYDAPSDCYRVRLTVVIATYLQEDEL